MKSSSHTTQKLSVIAAVLLIGLIAGVHGRGLDVAVTSGGAILSGGPTTEEAKRALEARIEQQAHGNVKLVDFIPSGTRESDVELSGRVFCQMEFAAQVEFAEPCRWAIRVGGKPLTFHCLKPGERNPQVSEMPGQTIEVSKRGERFTVHGSVWFSPGEKGWTPAGFAVSGMPDKTTDAQAKLCTGNLRRICMGFRMWSMDNADHFPFNVSTNAGGSLEFCRRDKDGFDENAALHLLVLVNELGTPQILVCPGDTVRKAAVDFKSLQATNISYQFRTGASVDETNAQEVLARRPIHGSVLRTDGSISEETDHKR